jgi:hypothetical protein
LSPADGGDIEQVAVRIGAAAFRIGCLAFLGRALGIELLNTLGDFPVVFNMKAEVIKSRLVSRLFGSVAFSIARFTSPSERCTEPFLVRYISVISNTRL